tara:strand:+ start:1029 stop:1721 length:693 start_codon:yes stop_codon:yes gene_type:complete
MEKYLIFGEDLTSIDVDNSDKTVETTTSLVNPVSLLNETSGTDGIIEVQLKAHADHTFGSVYGSIAGGDFAADDYVTINSSGYTVGASNGIITILTTTEDAVNGVDVSSTANNNDFRINLLKHIDGGTLGCFPASKFKGIQMVDADETDLYFEAGTGDIDAVDVIKVTHGSGKFKQCVDMVNDALSPDKNSSVIDFFVGGSSGATGTSIADVAFNGNPAGITSVDIQLDS